jgi:predicted small secreted protein
MKALIKQLVIVISSSVLLCACATVSEDSGLGRDIDFRGSDCISIRTIRDYTPLDRSTLLIEGSGNRVYLVTLMSPALELRSAIRLGVSSRDEWLCSYGGDRLVFGGFMSDEAMILGISRLTSEQEEELLIRYGKKEPDEQQDQAPPNVKGAEVEELGQIG